MLVQLAPAAPARIIGTASACHHGTLRVLSFTR
ncbi:hypothetical protein QFZ76_009420 [Streptomyces sp. V4I2]|nr:hypothetical protein [Streptomyces sp. V4I2]